MAHPWLQRLPEARKQRVHGLIAAVQVHPLGHRQAHDDAERAPSHAAIAPAALPANTLPLLLRGQRPVLVHKAGVLEGARLTSDLRPASYAGEGGERGREGSTPSPGAQSSVLPEQRCKRRTPALQLRSGVIRAHQGRSEHPVRKQNPGVV